MKITCIDHPGKMQEVRGRDKECEPYTMPTYQKKKITGLTRGLQIPGSN